MECTHCGMRMTGQYQDGSPVRYFHCGGCHRWASSAYQEVLRGDAHFRAVEPEPPSAQDVQFEAVKDKLERWLAALDDQDPYRVLGVSPMDSAEVVKNRYRELAFRSHPDRSGGSQDRMRTLNLAYERVLAHRESRRLEAPARALPARSR